MNSAQIHELISELTAITEEERQKCLNGEEIVGMRHGVPDG